MPMSVHLPTPLDRQSSSIAFLARHGIDFNTIFKSGLFQLSPSLSILSIYLSPPPYTHRLNRPCHLTLSPSKASRT